MSEQSNSSAIAEKQRSTKRLRLISYGMAFAGIVTLLVAAVSTRPHGIVVFGLGGLAVAALVFERTQGGSSGISLGILIGSIAAWLWPTIGDGGLFFLGSVLVTVGAANAVLLPRFYRLGRRLGAGSQPPNRE